MINDLVDIIIKRLEEIESIKVYISKTYLTIKTKNIRIAVAYFYSTEVSIATTKGGFNFDYDDLIDIDEFIGLIFCKALYNDA